MKIIGLSLVVLVGLGLIVGIWTLVPDYFKVAPRPITNSGLVAFTSSNDLKTYLDTARATFPTTSSFGSRDFSTIGAPTAAEGSKDSSTTTTARFIGTNVQVGGLDEPDSIKSDGRGIYVGSDMVYAFDTKVMTDSVSGSTASNPPMVGTGTADGEAKATEEPIFTDTIEPARSTEPNNGIEPDINPTTIIAPEPDRIILPPEYLAETKVVDVRTPAAIVERTALKEQGEMVIDGDSLVFLQGTGLKAYTIADPAAPRATWTYTLPANASIVTARARDGEIILITQQVTSPSIGCPMPLLKGERDVSVACGSIYHPVDPAPVTAIYGLTILNAATGAVTGTVATTGAQYLSTVMVSPTAAYLTYPETTDPVAYELEILRSLGSVLPTSVRTRLTTIDGYDLSAESTLREVQRAIDEYRLTLSANDAKSFDTKIAEARAAYERDHLRDTMKTGIVKIELDTARVVATGVVPGHVLNQYSLDEHNGALRIATTVGQSWWGTSSESVNDVYVLDAQLRETGAVRDLGRGERIYAVRFVGDRGYVVTFKQIDPFYVLDLSDPRRPERRGELKIPGYSSYLHPLTDTLILGIGQDGINAKATLFDVANASDPKAVATVSLPGGWSEVQSNPRAFLHDPKHTAVFVPAGDQGVILEYAATSLTTQRTVDNINARRAFVLGDRMMVVGTTGVVVLKESDWTTEQQLTFTPRT